MVASQVPPEMTGASTGWEERALQAKGTAPQCTGLVCWRDRTNGHWGWSWALQLPGEF